MIEIVPWNSRISAEIAIPGSKSLTNRALILAALAHGSTLLKGALWSEDTQVMVEALQALGFDLKTTPEPDEPANRSILVNGCGGTIPAVGTDSQPLELFVGNAGTAARFLAAILCLGKGCFRLQGVPRMHERPQASLFHALRQLGYRIESTHDKLPVVIHGTGPKHASCSVSVEESSQFASALILGAKIGGWNVHIEGENEEELPYVQMTRHLCDVFPTTGGTYQIEPDSSSGSYFWAASYIHDNCFKSSTPSGNNGIRVCHWPQSNWQVDSAFPRFLPLPDQISRKSHLGDSILTAMALAPLGKSPVLFTDLGRLRVQECDRVKAMKTELMRCGAKVDEIDDTLRIFPSELHGAEIETYQDHRIAMCFSILGLIIPGIRIKNPGCVKKTFPNFYEKLAAAPPRGLGVEILDAKQGGKTTDLFAQ